MRRITYVGIAIMAAALMAVGGQVSVYAGDGKTSGLDAYNSALQNYRANVAKFSGIVSGPGAAYFRKHQMVAQANKGYQKNQDSFFSPDPVDKDLADVGKFRGSMGRMFGSYMRSGRGFNEPPYVSPNDPVSGASCGNGPFDSTFGPTPPGQGC
jgi:hypothetical protein